MTVAPSTTTALAHTGGASTPAQAEDAQVEADALALRAQSLRRLVVAGWLSSSALLVASFASLVSWAGWDFGVAFLFVPALVLSWPLAQLGLSRVDALTFQAALTEPSRATVQTEHLSGALAELVTQAETLRTALETRDEVDTELQRLAYEWVRSAAAARGHDREVLRDLGIDGSEILRLATAGRPRWFAPWRGRSPARSRDRAQALAHALAQVSRSLSGASTGYRSGRGLAE